VSYYVDYRTSNHLTAMKNRYLKGAHISERKVREMLKLFSEDLTATQIANISGISRITVNAYLKLIRTHLAIFSDENNLLHKNGNSSGYLLNGSNGVNVQEPSKKYFYGIYKHVDYIYTEKLTGINSEWLYDWLKGKIQAEGGLIEKHRLQVFHGIADFNSIKLFRINTPPSGNVKGRSSIDEIDMFWGLLKSRLVKFRGLNSSTLHLHVKETEFRYNHRNEEIYELIVNIIQRKPLHLSKQS